MSVCVYCGAPACRCSERDAMLVEIDRLRAENKRLRVENVALGDRDDERRVRKQLAGLLAPWPANHWTCNEEFVAWQVEVARTLAASDALDQETTR